MLLFKDIHLDQGLVENVPLARAPTKYMNTPACGPPQKPKLVRKWQVPEAEQARPLSWRNGFAAKKFDTLNCKWLKQS
jgi:hypothetical protein